jgi:hypothetical protein
VCPKRRISYISQGAEEVSPWLHEQVKLGKPRECVYCKGLRFRDRPKKWVALAEIAANQGSESSIHQSIYGCKQCNVYLCRNRGCFDVFHRER